MTDFQPRPGQNEVLEFVSGKMGISAVPGSGKTRTLAELAALLIAERIEHDQEVLIVTLVNSAVDNFRSRVNRSIKMWDLLPNFGYRVRTLHGLAHDIVRERPGLVGLSEDFGILDEREATSVRKDAVETWLRAHPDAIDPFLDRDQVGHREEWVKRNQWPRLAQSVAAAFIKRAKDLSLTPETLLEALAQFKAGAFPPGNGTAHQPATMLSLAQMGTKVYIDYQRSLAYRGAVDFDDLIRLALQALKLDSEFLARLQQQWPYVLEDEAQDSSSLQEEILRLLVGGNGNWVRVGDTNQAIYDTFTTADPAHLRAFLQESGVQPVEMIQSGRSQKAIIDLANKLIRWTFSAHPTQFAREKAFAELFIQPTSSGDAQPNPPFTPNAIQLIDRSFTPDAELRAVADSLERWLPEHADWTVAVLVPRNDRGGQVIELLRQRGIEHVELLRSTSVTRRTAGALGNLLRSLADPSSARRLSIAFKVWRRDKRGDPESEALTKAVAGLMATCPAVEAYLWPRADHDWLASETLDPPGAHMRLLLDFRETARRWHKAATLPIDQLILTLAGDIFQEPSELALAHKLALLLRDVAQAHPSYRLAELVEELAVIARNERRFLGFSKEDTDFEPPPGKVTVATMHKAKGLEWDRVYLMSVNNYAFPSGQPHDNYISEPWFIRDHLNLEAEALVQLQALANILHLEPGKAANPDAGATSYEGEASRQARLDYVAERLRLLYVGITRARRDLILTWNTGRRREAQQATPFIALQSSDLAGETEPAATEDQAPND